METREIVLAGLLGSTVALWYGHMALVSNVFEPLAARRKELVDLQIERSQQQSVKTRQLRAAKQLGDWSKRGLPADPSTALALYHNWLIEWATKQGLTDVVVTPGRVDPKPKDKTYYVIPMTVKAKGRLETAVKALHEFHAAGMLQRVRNLAAASPARDGDPDLDLTMQVEALSLVDAPPPDHRGGRRRADGACAAHGTGRQLWRDYVAEPVCSGLQRSAAPGGAASTAGGRPVAHSPSLGWVRRARAYLPGGRDQQGWRTDGLAV